MELSDDFPVSSATSRGRRSSPNRELGEVILLQHRLEVVLHPRFSHSIKTNSIEDTENPGEFNGQKSMDFPTYYNWSIHLVEIFSLISVKAL